MLRIISGLLLLIISQIVFASVSTTNSIVPATSTSGYAYRYYITGRLSFDSAVDSCKDYASYLQSTGANRTYVSASSGAYGVSNGSCNLLSDGWANYSVPIYINRYTKVTYSCASGTLSDVSGNASSSGQYCNVSTQVDSCTSYAGQSVSFWVPFNSNNPPASVCSGTCLANKSTSNTVSCYWNGEVDVPEYQVCYYTYTGATGDCTSDTVTDEAAASAANAEKAAAEKQAKIDQAIADAKAGCGGEGHYTSGTFNGDTVIACTDEPSQTTVNNTAVSTTTTANPDGSTTTTTTTTSNNNTSITNNNSSTTIGSNGGTSTSPATTGGSSNSTTKTETVTTNPDGSTTTEVTETTSGAGNTAGVFESPAEGTDYLKDVFGSESLKQLVDQQTAVKEQITLLQSNIKGLFSFSSIAAGGSMESNNQTIMGASVDLSGKSIIDLFTQGNIASAFWILAVLIGITVVLTKRN